LIRGPSALGWTVAALVAALVALAALGLGGRGPAAGLWRSGGPRPGPRPPAGAAPTPESAESFAGRFVVAYLSWRWDRPLDLTEAQVRPYVTDRLWRRLTTEPSSQWTNPGGRDLHEVDSVRVQAAQVTERSPGAATVVLTAVVTIQTDRGASVRPWWVRVRVVGRPGRWAVDEVDR
jgi:hypothetical protein